ncbi:Uncharacterised protein [Moraxella ovis]|nr:Uncharacterised protein [Moraxella ovis]
MSMSLHLLVHTKYNQKGSYPFFFSVTKGGFDDTTGRYGFIGIVDERLL